MSPFVTLAEARSLAQSILNGTPRDQPNVGTEDALQTLALAVVVLTDPPRTVDRAVSPADEAT